mgnify:CR=1 FL=1
MEFVDNLREVSSAVSADEFVNELPVGVTSDIDDSGNVETNSNKKRKLSKQEQYKLTRMRLKTADKRNRANQRKKLDLVSNEEREVLKARRVAEQHARNDRLIKLMESNTLVEPHPNINICIDFSLDCEHNDRERRSLCKQLCFAYFCVKKMTENPIRMYMSGINSENNQSGVLRNSLIRTGVNGWHINVFDECVWEIPHIRKQKRDQVQALGTDKCVCDSSGSNGETESPTSPIPNPSMKHMICPHSLPDSSLFCQSKSYVLLSPDADEAVTSFDSDKVSCMHVLL